jgi:hypothetical protein
MRLGELSGLDAELAAARIPSRTTLLTRIALLVGWSREEMTAVKDDVAALEALPCTTHQEASCAGCRRKTYCNGHLLEAAVHMILVHRERIRIRSDELGRALRMSADLAKLPDWDLVARVRRWEAAANLQVIR